MAEISSSKAAIRKRQSRVKQAEVHRRASFISEYIRVKYGQIYEEADSFYYKLARQYPLKRKLSTAPEYIVWKTDVEKLNAATTATTELPDVEKLNAATTATTELPDVEKLNAATTATTELPDVEKLNAATTATTELRDVDASLNISLMSPDDVQEARDIQMFQDIYPSIVKEINPEIINQVIREIQETVPDFFDEDMDDMLNEEINISLKELSPLEQELLKY